MSFKLNINKCNSFNIINELTTGISNKYIDKFNNSII